jgi:hypothetical protein
MALRLPETPETDMNLAPAALSGQEHARPAITGFTAADLTLRDPDMLSMEVFSVADLAVEDRVARIGQAFDQHPDLRPIKIGPHDPPRIKVGDSMAAVLAAQQLALDWWLMVRQSRPVYEGGELKLYPGRGRFLRLYTGEGRWDLHEVGMYWSAGWIREHHAEEAALELFTAVCESAGAAHGMLGPVHHAGQWMAFTGRARAGPGQLEQELRDVTWANYFGPAFAVRFPKLAGVTGARTLASGGILVRTADSPWNFEGTATSPGSYAWKHPLYEVLGRHAFVEPGVAEKAGGHLPTLREHMSYTAGTQELPEQRWERERAAYDSEKDTERRRKRFERAHARLLATAPAAAPTRGRVEFSVGSDPEEVQRLWRLMARRFRGDLAAERGKALLASMLSAPLDSEEHHELAIDGPEGPELVTVGWFMDDVDAPDLYVHGSPALAAELNRLLEAD